MARWTAIAKWAAGPALDGKRHAVGAQLERGVSEVFGLDPQIAPKKAQNKSLKINDLRCVS
jgi:hypothetical protein